MWRDKQIPAKKNINHYYSCVLEFDYQMWGKMSKLSYSSDCFDFEDLRPLKTFAFKKKKTGSFETRCKMEQEIDLIESRLTPHTSLDFSTKKTNRDTLYICCSVITIWKLK